jgi:hypothetical protein
MKTEKTLNELRAELATAKEAIEAAEIELREVEATGDTGAKNLERHGRITSRLAVLRTQHASMTTALCPATLAELRQAEAEAHTEFETAFAEYKRQFQATMKILAEIFDFKDWNLTISSDELAGGAIAVVEKSRLLEVARHKSVTATRTATEFARSHAAA